MKINISYYNTLEKDYFDKFNKWKVEENILYSFSKKDLLELIEKTQDEYIKVKLPYSYNIARKQFKPWYEDINDFDKYFIERYEYYFNWWDELEKTNKFLERLKVFYISNYERLKKYKNFKKFDINTISIVEVLGKYMSIPNNLNRNCKCPLHKEKTWSFRIYKNTNSWFCFWCNEWGNIVNFVSKIENISNKEAYKKLATLYSNY